MSTSPEQEPGLEVDPAFAPIPPVQFALRAAWIALRLLLVICLGEQGVQFFYQGF